MQLTSGCVPFFMFLKKFRFERNVVHCLLENLALSYLRQAPTLLRVFVAARDLLFNFCWFGKLWRKRSKISVWNFSNLESCSRTCCRRKGICSCTLQFHIRLTGAMNGHALTKVVKPYPSQMCTLLVAKAVDGIYNPDLYRKVSSQVSLNCKPFRVLCVCKVSAAWF